LGEADGFLSIALGLAGGDTLGVVSLLGNADAGKVTAGDVGVCVYSYVLVCVLQFYTATS
jgi:hypothetical protein